MDVMTREVWSLKQERYDLWDILLERFGWGENVGWDIEPVSTRASSKERERMLRWFDPWLGESSHTAFRFLDPVPIGCVPTSSFFPPALPFNPSPPGSGPARGAIGQRGGYLIPMGIVSLEVPSVGCMHFNTLIL